MNIELTVNQKKRQIDVDPAKPLLWVLKEDLGIHHAKFGCGFAICGACSVYVGDDIVRACVYPISMVKDKEVKTVAGLDDDLARELKAAWQKFDVPQCGYCQPGFIVSSHKLLSSHKENPNQELDLSQLTNLCRCGTYQRVREAVSEAYQNNHLKHKE